MWTNKIMKKRYCLNVQLLKTLQKPTSQSVWSNNIFNKVYVAFSVAVWCKCIRSVKWLHSNIRGSWGSSTVQLFAQTLMFKSKSMVTFVAAEGEFLFKCNILELSRNNQVWGFLKKNLLKKRYSFFFLFFFFHMIYPRGSSKNHSELNSIVRLIHLQSNLGIST